MGDPSTMNSTERKFYLFEVFKIRCRFIERVLERHGDEIREEWALEVPKSLAGIFKKVILSNGVSRIQVGWELRGGGTLPGPSMDIDTLAERYPDCDVGY